MCVPAVVQSAEELDKQRLEAQQKRDAQMKQERADRAKENAEQLAKQKVCTASVPSPALSGLHPFCPIMFRHKSTHPTLLV